MGKATKEQSEFIKDLVLNKFAVFSEFKKWLATTGIVRTNGQIFKRSMNLIQIMNRVTKNQASEIITAMQLLDDIQYQDKYDQESIEEAETLLADIKREVSSWTFDS